MTPYRLLDEYLQKQTHMVLRNATADCVQSKQDFYSYYREQHLTNLTYYDYFHEEGVYSSHGFGDPLFRSNEISAVSDENIVNHSNMHSEPFGDDVFSNNIAYSTVSCKFVPSVKFISNERSESFLWPVEVNQVVSGRRQSR